ncbi:MAG: UvrD-helicase domain-containing protein [Bacteroidota bacterium]
MSPLSVYKASAGSGKTYSLTLEYIRILLTSERKHRGILAVTFTNKAAGEMKERILRTLSKLSANGTGEECSEMSDLIRMTGLARETIADRAGNELSAILNDYSWFSVGTIDRFFQSVIRAFTREFGLQPGFNLELDRDKVLNESVDRLFMKLTGDRELQDWLTSFAEDNIERAASWNFSRQIVALGAELFREEYQQILLEQGGKPVTREEVGTFFTRVKDLAAQTEGKMKQRAAECLAAIAEAGLEPESFSGGKNSSPGLYFRKIADGTFKGFTDKGLRAISDPEEWMKKDLPEEGTQLVIRLLQPALGEIYSLYHLFNSASEIIRNLFTMGILGDIADRITEYTDEKNIFLLNDSSRFLKGLIGNNPTPFIYEKAGNFYDQIMLDEFQDTSVFQWDNFLPLLINSLSSGYDSLLVGDVKQSIYRFRNSDWRILADQVEKDLQRFSPQIRPLLVNFRSLENIVDFNNSLFSGIPTSILKLLQEMPEKEPDGPAEEGYWTRMIRNAYSDVKQEIPSGKKGSGGYVEMKAIAGENKELFREKALSGVSQWIEQLEDRGFRPGDITVLVRTKSEGAEVVRWLMEYDRDRNRERKYNFDLISNESLFLNNNQAIRMLLALLTFIRGSAGELDRLLLKYTWSGMTSAEDKPLHTVFSSATPLEEVLPESFFADLDRIRRLPLYEMCETLISLFELDRKAEDIPYIQAFLDNILDLQKNEALSLYHFLEYWKEAGPGKAVTVSESQDAIRVMTIHKSKGLQFRAVLLPFCDWEFHETGKKERIIWCSTASTPFDGIPLVPLKYSKRLRDTLFSKAWYEEWVREYVDNMNLLYVAFTRAEEVLMAAFPAGKSSEGKENKINDAGALIRSVLRPGAESQFNGSFKAEGEGEIYRSGSIPPGKQKEKKDKEWTNFSAGPARPEERLRLRLRSRDFRFSREGEARTLVDFGTLMHEIFSRIRTREDVDRALRISANEGLLSVREMEELSVLIREKLALPRVSDWFMEEDRVLTERDILLPGDIVYRPDRVVFKEKEIVVVDYKFGHQVAPSYLSQVRKYASLVQQLENKPVKAFVWYVALDRIDEA